MDTLVSKLCSFFNLAFKFSRKLSASLLFLHPRFQVIGEWKSVEITEKSFTIGKEFVSLNAPLARGIGRVLFHLSHTIWQRASELSLSVLSLRHCVRSHVTTASRVTLFGPQESWNDSVYRDPRDVLGTARFIANTGQQQHWRARIAAATFHR